MQTQLSRMRLAICLLTLACAGWAQASVVMVGTRVIYPAAMREQTLQFQNPDQHPNVVQVWLDDGDAQATPDTAQSPFLALPQIFRVEPHAGQMVRLILADASELPQDRESVFYLNFSQLPAQKKEDQAANQLLLMFTSRLKVFYRPKSIAANAPANLAEKLQLAWRDGALHVRNPTAYHVVIDRADLLPAQGDPVPMAKAQMLAPFADATWQQDANVSAQHVSGMPLRLELVNDFGGRTVVTLKVP